MAYVAWKDPGFINPAKHQNEQTPLSYEGTDERERLFYARSHIYQPRYCESCRITRPALSSHCNFCNACVVKFDHHCTVLNQCIGVRNHKAFVIYLVCTEIMFLYLMLLTIWLFVTQDMLPARIH
jgi:hypothetical protein